MKKSQYILGHSSIERMAFGAIKARRLVRTESAYVEEMAELESYKECGIDKLRFCATLDMRTSDKCAAHDGEIIEVKNAVPGVNIPPLHPWCRSTTIGVFDDKAVSELKRRAKDPETGEDMFVPADTTYEEWKSEIDTRNKANAGINEDTIKMDWLKAKNQAGTDKLSRR